MKSDEDIKREIEAELSAHPSFDRGDVIAVAVKDGIVTLMGIVRSYNDKLDAEEAVKRVAGVMGAANELEVHLPDEVQRPDVDIARDIVAMLRSDLPDQWDRIKVLVEDDRVTLEGDVETNAQREVAERIVRYMKGVKGLTDRVQVKPSIPPVEIKCRIEETLRRSAELDANRIVVETHGDEVILKGTVRSWAERQEAERTAWSVPGVARVIDEIAIVYP